MSSAAGARDGKDTSGTVASQQEGHGFQSHSGLFFVFSPCVGVAYGSSISNLGLTDNSEPRIGAILLSVVCLPAINGRLVVGVSPPSPLRPLGQPPGLRPTPTPAEVVTENGRLFFCAFSCLCVPSQRLVKLRLRPHGVKTRSWHRGSEGGPMG